MGKAKKYMKNCSATCLTTINALLFLFIPDVLAYFEIAGIHQRYSTVLYSFYCVKVILNFLILVTRHNEIRQNIYNFIRILFIRRSSTTSSTPKCHKQASNVITLRNTRPQNE
ncbi:hypothetical protein GCK32_001337 [Trichostrongylus colubriformis]|uniref:Uncharacterized protein n=1 Tax=Trichostrongylus colubriformis TaxID=6319 RepID=A0AAN8F066_TRICO